MKLTKLFAIAACIVGSTMSLSAAGRNIRWHDEANDTVTISDILTEAAGHRFANPSECVGYMARQFIGRPYVAHTLEGPEELLTVNLDELDCTTFVDVSMALAATVLERRQGWQDYVYNLEKMRYRNGRADGYASRLHYNCDWAMDNIHRGNIADVTSTLPKCKYLVRSIDFMSANRDRYPSLADSVEFERIVGVENGYRNHRFPYIKTADLYDRAVQQSLREGDILAFVSNLKNLDITHMGIVVMKDGKPYALHASSTHGKVEISEVPLADFVKRNRYWIGIRVYRLKD